MAQTLILSALAPESAKAYLGGAADRERIVRDAVAALGGNVLAFYMIEGGEWDIAAIVDDGVGWPTDRAVATRLAVLATGINAKWRSYRLTSTADVDAAAKQVGMPLAPIKS